MDNYQSPKWQIFVSRPTSILKRDFMKWVYLELGRIKGLKLTKLAAIGNDKEMDVFVDKKEDAANYRQTIKHYRTGKIKKTFSEYQKLIENYRPQGRTLPEQCLRAMKEVGPILIYSYYVERLANLGKSGEKDKLIELNGQLRDLGAKIIYPLYNDTYKFLRKKYKRKLIDNCTIAELPKSISRAEINERKKFYIFIGIRKDTKIYAGEASKKFLKRNGFTKVKKNKVDEARGLPACPGKARGRVKIVRRLSDFKKSDGKIIVARDTIIEYTPYLKKVLGLVTDIGGVSCHAAITAREFNIPCVVGTKFATQIFKDGDTAEIDAVNGVVKKL
ncbi:MAG: PEP-utilizing enzyme [Patescibacteria group bacterium]